MPPQRRKIVPPTTTSKVRRKVAGTGKSAASTPDATGVEGSESTETAASTPAVEKAGAEKSGAEKSGAEKSGSAKPSAEKSSPAKSSPAKSSPAKPSLSKAGAAETSSDEKTDPVTPEVSDESETVESPAASSGGSKSGIGYKHVVIVAVIAVVLGAFATLAWFKPFATIDNEAWVDSAATQEVTSAATDALQTLYTYKAETIDSDFDAARAVLNQSMLDEFNSTADTTKAAVVQTDTGTEAMVTDIGVTLLQGDKAELLANVNISATQNGSASGSAEGPLTVNMEKIDGTWKLSAIDDQ